MVVLGRPRLCLGISKSSPMSSTVVLASVVLASVVLASVVLASVVLDVFASASLRLCPRLGRPRLAGVLGAMFEYSNV